MTAAAVLPRIADVSLPADWRGEVEPRLDEGERPVASVELDLDDRLRYAPGLLVLTERRLIAAGPDRSTWRSWPLQDHQVLELSDHGGVGSLELRDANARIAVWRFTLGQHAAAQRVADRFARLAGARSPAATAICPRCQAPLPAAGAPCPRCAEEGPAEAAGQAEPAESEEPPSTWTLFRLWRFARPYRRQLLAGFLLTLASTAATLVPPYMTMPLMDDVLIPFQNGQPIDVRLVGMYLGGLLAAALLAWGLGWARTYILALVSERIGADLRTAAYDHLLSLSVDFFGSKRTGDLIARIGSETDRINVFLSLHLLDFATDVLMIAMTAVILVSIDPSLAMATLLPLPFIAWLIHLVRERLRTGFEKIDRVWAQVTSVLADTIPGVRVVKAFAQERHESDRFAAANQRNLRANDRLNRTWSLFTPTVSLLTEVGLLVVWAFGIWQIAHERISVGVLTAFLAYIGRFYTRLDTMSRIVSVTQKAAAGAKRIFDILDHVSSVPEPADPKPLGRVAGRIELRGVSFRYGNRTVLQDIDLRVEPGEMIGLVGHSGSGKSTLVNLILRFQDPATGSILLDGTDIRNLGIADYRRHIGLVLQESFLFFGTVAENIAYGRPDATRQEIVAAARAAHAHDFILRLPHGYDSLVGERGQSLSGGERQRIAIARALLIDPRILILDEATASVDTETEQEIQRALDNLVKGRTTIAIAHRLSTLRQADRLVVLDRGRIVEQGRHEELLVVRGAYFRLHEAQARLAAAQFGPGSGPEADEPPAAADHLGRGTS